LYRDNEKNRKGYNMNFFRKLLLFSIATLVIGYLILWSFDAFGPHNPFFALRGVSNSVGLATEPTEILSFFSKNSMISVATKGLAHPFGHSPFRSTVIRSCFNDIIVSG
jgi:hypothetical protein